MKLPKPAWMGILLCALIAPAKTGWLTESCPSSHGFVKYAIVMEAGSASVDMRVFKFELMIGGDVKILKETFHTISPALDKAPNVTKQLRPLVKKAERIVPDMQRTVTPIMLMATGDLERLPDKKREALFEVARKVVSLSNFHYTGRSVGVLDGSRRAFYCWLTVAFTQNSANLLNKKIAVINLGSLSLQLAFLPVERETLGTKNHLHKYKLPGVSAEQKVYAHAYEGGLFASRAKIIRKLSGKTAKTATVFNVSSPCIHPEAGLVTGEFKGALFSVWSSVSSKEDFAFQPCYDLVKSYVRDLRLFAPKELQKFKLYLGAFFFPFAVDAQLIGRREHDKILFVKGFKRRAVHECSGRSNQLRNNEYFCQDLTFIYSLLHDGLLLSDEKEIHLATRLNGTVLGWPLGAALNSLTTV